MKNLLIISICFIPILITGCDNSLFGIKGSGEILKQDLTIAEFNKIDLAIDAEIEIIKDENRKVEIVAQQNIFELIKTEIVSDKWIIDFTKEVSDYKQITIYIYTPKIEGIEISGSGDIYSSDTFSNENTEFSISGSGDIDFLVDSENTQISIPGSGSINLVGGTINQDISISGSGDVNCFKFFSDKSEVNISGSGKTEIYVRNNLFVTISGSGNVYYKGEPSVNSIITGSGKVINSN